MLTIHQISFCLQCYFVLLAKVPSIQYSLYLQLCELLGNYVIYKTKKPSLYAVSDTMYDYSYKYSDGLRCLDIENRLA